MNLWIDGAVVTRSPLIKWFDAETALSVLVGHRIDFGPTITVQAVYRPLLVVDHRKGITRIEIAVPKNKGWRLFLMRRRPFIKTERLDYEETIYMFGNSTRPC